MALRPPRSDSTAVITGASSGIGRSLASELVGRGYGVTLVARREDRLRELSAMLGARVRVRYIVADLADPEARADLFSELGQLGEAVDIFINNAGVGTFGPVADACLDKELQQVRVNVEAVIDLTTRAVQNMVPRERGSILNVSSTAAFNPFPGQAGYAATKAFVLSYTEALRVELRHTGVTAAALCPGPVRTEFLAAAGTDEEVFSAAFPGFMWEQSEDIAKAAIDGLDQGRGVIVPGHPSAISAQIFRHLPRRALLPMIANRHPALRNSRARPEPPQ